MIGSKVCAENSVHFLNESRKTLVKTYKSKTLKGTCSHRGDRICRDADTRIFSALLFGLDELFRPLPRAGDAPVGIMAATAVAAGIPPGRRTCALILTCEYREDRNSSQDAIAWLWPSLTVAASVTCAQAHALVRLSG